MICSESAKHALPAHVDVHANGACAVFSIHEAMYVIRMIIHILFTYYSLSIFGKPTIYTHMK